MQNKSYLLKKQTTSVFLEMVKKSAPYILLKYQQIIGSYRIGLETDIVDSDITLLFSKSLIKEKTKF